MLRLLGILVAPILCMGSVRTLASLPKTEITAIAVTASGAIYVTGYITSANLPVTAGAFQRDYHGGACPGVELPHPCADGFVAKFDASGHLVYATYLGGAGDDLPQAIAVDANGNAYITGNTSSNDFPQTANHFSDSSPNYAFVTKLNSSGTGLVFSTKLPGVAEASAIAIDVLGQTYIGGTARGPGLPVTAGTIQSEFHGAAGYRDGVVLKLDAGGGQILFATYLGGSREDFITAVALDSEANVYVGGDTNSVDFPFTQGWLNTNDDYTHYFAAKLNASGTNLLYAVRPGGSCGEHLAAITVDRAGRAFLTGWTCSADYPITAEAIVREIGETYEAFATVMSADGSSIEYSTYLGGGVGTSIALDGQSRIVVAGYTTDLRFPTSADGPLRCNSAAPDELYEGFLVRLNPANPFATFATYLDIPRTDHPQLATLGGGTMLVAGPEIILAVDSIRATGINLVCVANSANGWPVPVAPGELIALYGVGIGPVAREWAVPDASGTIATELAGTRVWFDGFPAPILMAGDDEVRAIVPFELSGQLQVRVEIERDGAKSGKLALAVSRAVPAIFQSDTTDRAAVLNQDGTVNSAANPAKRGTVITFWATGLGSMEPAVPDGSIASADRLSKTATTPEVGFFGWPAEVLYSGSAPGMVAGVVQINARVPEQMGPFAYPVDLILTYGAIYIPTNRVTVNVQ